jgi:hypothetical protein
MCPVITLAGVEGGWIMHETQQPQVDPHPGSAQQAVAFLSGAFTRPRGASPEVFAVHGPAGSGKTTLVRTFTKELGDKPVVWTGAREAASTGLATLIELSANQRRVLVIDDVTEADSALLAGVLRDLSQTELSRTMVILIGRDPAAGWVSPIRVELPDLLIHQVAVNNLRPRDLAALLRARGERESGTALWRMTGGNLALASAWLSSPPPRHADSIPDAVVGLAHRLMDELPSNERSVLKALAVNGEPATVGVLSFLLDGPSMLGPCQHLADRGLLQWRYDDTGSEKIEFVAPLLERAIYASLQRTDRQRLHERAALRATGPRYWRHRVGATTQDDNALADELAAAAEGERLTNPVRASSYLLWASRLGDDAEAAEARLTAAIRLLVLAGREGAASAHVTDVMQFPFSMDQQEALGLLAFTRREVSAARDHFTHARNLASEAGDDEAVARISSELAYVSATMGFGAEAVRDASQAIRHSSEPLIVATGMTFRALGRALQEGPRAGIEALPDLPANPEQATSDEVPLITQRGIFAALLGDFASAERDLSVAVKRGDSNLGRVLGLSPYIHLIWVNYMLGAWGEASQLLDTAFSAQPDYGRGLDIAVLYSLSAILNAGTDDLTSARADLAEARTIAERSDYSSPQLHLAIARAAIAQSQGDHREVLSVIEGLEHSTLAADSLRLYEVWWLPAKGLAEIQLREFRRARETIARLSKCPSEGSWLPLSVALLRGELAAKEGRYSAAQREFDDGLAFAPTAADPLLYRGMLTHAAGRLATRLNDPLRSASLLADARRIFERIGARSLLQQVTQDEAALGPGALWSGSLTGREREIASFVGKGWTNPEIAAKLFISTKTVEYHLRHVYLKLGMTSRRELRDAIHADEARQAM